MGTALAVDLNLEDDNPYLGLLVDENGREVWPPMPLAYNGDKHLLSFGTTGAGKSMALIVPNLATLRRSMIVIDPKGQLAAITAKERARMGRVIVINPFGLWVDEASYLESAGWNPALQLTRGPNFGAGGKAIADAIIEKRANTSGSSKFFDNSAEKLVKAWVLWERLTKGDDANLSNVPLQLATMPPAVFLETLRKMSQCDVRSVSVTAARLYTRLSDKNAHSTSAQDVIDTALSEMEFLDDPYIEADMKRGDAIPFAKMHDEIITVYVMLPVGELEAQTKYLRLFVNLALAELFRAPPRRPKLPRVLFCLDECGNLGRLPQILKALNIARDYRIQLWMFFQNLQQLKRIYTDEWTYFEAGAGAMSTFNTGDWETAEHFSKLFGNREVDMTSRSKSGGNRLTGFLHPWQVQLAETTATHVFPLIAPDDLRRLGKGGTMNYIEPCPQPVRAVAPGYWELFKPGALSPNPYYHGD